ncbi:MAG TPA: iron uptake system protein EfeO [Mycobacteriales bacterium]|jgi:iron uptake system component EfeO|nr:iron uptake system protein EfeO [Mycobacteriales bacterium]
MRGVRILVATATVLALAACGSGGSGDSAPAAAPSTPAAAATTAATPDLTAQIATYQAYVVKQAVALQADGKKFTDALRAGNLAEAKKQFAPSRYKWEGIEPIALLVSRFDVALDSRVDDHSSVNDPQWTGWHKIEYILWTKNTTAGTRALADKLDTDLATLTKAVSTVKITPDAVIKGASDLVAEVSDGKITGEEDRYSHTDLSDFAANVEGAKAAYDAFRSVLQTRSPQLVSTVDNAFTEVEKSLAAYQDGAGYKLYPALKPDDKLKMQAHLSTLSESLAMVPAALSLS